MLSILGFSFLFWSNTARAESYESLDFELFKNPPTEYRPWARWWWPGNDVDEGELRREVNLLADHFFGGVEVQAFVMGLNPDAPQPELERRLSFDSDSFYRHLASVMDEAGARGLLVDLNLGSGWPSGGAHIREDRGLKTLLWNEKVLWGPKRVWLKVPHPRKPIFYSIAKIAESLMHTKVATYLGDSAKLEAVIAAKVRSGRRSWNPLNFADQLALEPDTVKVITDRVKIGVLDWEVPAGRWVVVFIFSAVEGEHPTLAAQPYPGFVVDHLDREAAAWHLHHLLGPRTGLEKFYGHPLRAFFNDSFEFKCERHFSDDFLAEFARRRGYDLTPYLPVVITPGADNFFMQTLGLESKAPFMFSENDQRVRYDYSLTVSDLFLENYLDLASQWARERGLLSRAQGYGMDMDVIRASGHADLPETEQLYGGGSEMFLKIASSGAHLYGRNIVSAESVVFAGRDYMTTPLKIKVAADKLFISGINHVIYHGYSYRKNTWYGETGWYPWSSPYIPVGQFSSNISEANPFWKYLPELNRYIARCQYLLRLGKPRVDLAVYYPWLGFPSGFSDYPGHDEILFNGYLPGEPTGSDEGLASLVPGLSPGPPDPRSAWLAELWPMLTELEDHGFTWEWVNDESLAAAEFNDGQIVIRGNEYKAVVIANAPWMQPEAVERLSELGKQGAPVLVLGPPPSSQPGFKDYTDGDERVRSAFREMQDSDQFWPVNTSKSLDAAYYESGLAGAVIYPEPDPPKFRYSRRKLEDHSVILFIVNPEQRRQSGSFYCNGCPKDCRWLDPENGQEYESKSLSDDGLHHLSLGPYGSMFLLCRLDDGRKINLSDSSTSLSQPPWCKLEPGFQGDWTIAECGGEKTSVKEIDIDGWSLKVAGPDLNGGSARVELDALKDWREIEELKCSSSPGLYTAEFEVSEEDAGKPAWLELGWFYGAAEVSLNGNHLGSVLLPPIGFEVTGLLRPGMNTVEVVIVPGLRNRFIGYAIRGDKLYKQFKNREDTLMPEGLIGPARLIVNERDSDE